MVGDGIAHRAASQDEVEHTPRNARFVDAIREGGSRRRRRAGGLDDHSVAECHGGSGLPRRNGDGEVPWRDEPEYPCRLAGSRYVNARPGGGEVLSVAAQGFAGEVFEDAPGARHFADSLRQGLALLAGEQAAQLFAPPQNDLPHAIQTVGPHFRRSIRPGRECLAGRFHRSIHLPPAAIRKPRDDLTGVGRVLTLVHQGSADSSSTDVMIEIFRLRARDRLVHLDTFTPATWPCLPWPHPPACPRSQAGEHFPGATNPESLPESCPWFPARSGRRGMPPTGSWRRRSNTGSRD